MNIVIPPLIFYVVGTALVIGGTVRALTLGRRNPDREISDDDPTRAAARRRHLIFGLIWVAMGIFLILSTVGVLRSKWGGGGAPGARTEGGGTILIEPAKPTTIGPPAAR